MCSYFGVGLAGGFVCSWWCLWCGLLVVIISIVVAGGGGGVSGGNSGGGCGACCCCGGVVGRGCAVGASAADGDDVVGRCCWLCCRWCSWWLQCWW